MSLTAGKLLARKRPNLIPVYDTAVEAWMGTPTHAWEPLREVLRTHPGLR